MYKVLWKSVPEKNVDITENGHKSRWIQVRVECSFIPYLIVNEKLKNDLQIIQNIALRTIFKKTDTTQIKNYTMMQIYQL